MQNPPTTQLSIPNWNTYQHYKDRRPEWIKLYRLLLSEYSFCCLNDSEKWLYIGLLLLASESENALKDDILWIKRRLSITSRKINENSIERLIALQLIERKEIDLKNASKLPATRKQDASSPLAPRKQNASPEAEKEAEKETEAEQVTAAAASNTAHARDDAAAAASKFTYSQIREFLKSRKPKNEQRNGGLANRLQQTGEDDHLIAAWIAEKEAAATAEAEAKQRENEQRIEWAQDVARELIQHGGLRDWQDALSLTWAVEYYHDVRNESEFNLRTFRQLKKMIPYALQFLRETPERAKNYAETIEQLQKLEASATAAP